MYNLVGENFINMIKSINPNARPVSGNSEMLIRCPFCGDSDNQRHAHLYIKIPKMVDELSFYECKRANCTAKGIVTEEFLRKLGCYDASVLVSISKHNAEVLKLPKYKYINDVNIYPLMIPNIIDSESNRYKLNYINSRIGSNFTYQDLNNLKIFLNLSDIVNYNRLELSRDINICNQLDSNFMGFISYDNSFANMRKLNSNNLYHSLDKKYINYDLIPKMSNSKNYYVIPTNINILDQSPVKIHVAEGAFDVLSIFYNLNNCNTNQCIYISCGGKSYNQALEFILIETGIINYELHIYPDADINSYIINRIINKINLLPSNIIIHHNTFQGEKDYGVPLNRIKDTVEVVKNIYGCV